MRQKVTRLANGDRPRGCNLLNSNGPFLVLSFEFAPPAASCRWLASWPGCSASRLAMLCCARALSSSIHQAPERKREPQE